MDIAIIGLPQSGRTATFNALTSGHATTEGGSAGPVQVGVVKVVDPRLDTLEQMYLPRKVVYAEIKFWDLPPAPSGKNAAQSGAVGTASEHPSRGRFAAAGGSGFRG